MQCDMRALAPSGAWPEAFELPGNAAWCLKCKKMLRSGPAGGLTALPRPCRWWGTPLLLSAF